MQFWMLFWQVIFILTVTLFAGLSIWVTFSGIQDIRRLFSHMDELHRQEPSNPK